MLARTLATGFLFSTVLVTGHALGEERPPVRYDWRSQAKRGGLSDAETDKLSRQKLLIAGPESQQVFQPYDGSTLPTFVTADSVLNAFHVLFEESVVRLERARAERLAAILVRLWDGIPEAKKLIQLPEEDLTDAVRRAQITIGVALRLLGERTPGAPEEILAAIEADVARVIEAKERTRPAWLGRVEKADGFPFIDYARFRPRGFYAGDERLVAYFRATAWLQTIPLRLDQDAEFHAAVVLSAALGDRGNDYKSFTGDGAILFGGSGDLPLETRVFGDRPWKPTDISSWRTDCESAWERQNGGSKGDAAPRDPRHGIEPGMRVLPAARLPEGRLFDFWCDPLSGTRREPSGLFVAAALGSEFSRKEALARLPANEARALAAAIDGSKNLASCGGLYGDYLRCLAALLDAPEPEAPPLFGSEEWQRKTANTVLAGWAQSRHTWVLQAREDVMWGGMEDTKAGFIEPDPEFYSRLARLVQASSEFLEQRGAFAESPSRREFLSMVREYATALRKGDKKRGRTELEMMVKNGRKWAILRWFETLRIEEGGIPLASNAFEEMSEEDTARVLKSLNEADSLLVGAGALPENLAACISDITPPLSKTWQKLERLCRRLEAMAHKQLRGQSWSEEERAFLLDFGAILGAAMQYEGNSWEHPNDDAPRAASYYADLRDPDAPRYFQAGIARPRALFVLFPWKGEEILCRGAVMPYREMSGPVRLTDAEWRARLDSPDAPESPAWMGPIVSPVPAKK